MVTRKAAETTVNGAVLLDPKTFTFDSVMARIKPPEPQTVSVFLAAELAPRLKELQILLDQDEAIPTERGMDDADPADKWLAEFNYLATEWNESEIQFVLRATKRSDRTRARAAMVADGLDLDDDDAEDISVCYVLAEVCTNSDMTGKQHLEFREQIGEIAFLPLLEALQKANVGAGVTAPFSLRHLPTQDSI